MIVDDTLLEPLNGYNKKYKEEFIKNAYEYFDRLIKDANVDVEANRQTIKDIKLKDDEIANIKKKIRKLKWKRFWLIVLGIITIIGLIFVIIHLKKKLNPIIRNSQEYLNDLIEQRNALIALAKKQMAPANQRFDWNIPAKLTEMTVPDIQMDQYFDGKKYEYLHQKYGLNDEDENISSVFIQSGSVVGNPFLLCKDFMTEMRKKAYSNSITIHWTTYVRTKEGTRAVHHTQTLTATIYEPAPVYWYQTYLVYGNEAAPNLTFSRYPTDVENMTEKQIEKMVRKTAKKLDKKETKAYLDNDDKTNYQRFGNDEFEAIFGGTDRNNELEFNLLFTPLAQKNLLHLMKTKDPYGDDFSFIKDKCLNYIQSEHDQYFDYYINPAVFFGYDHDLMRENFVKINSKWFKSFYFDIAPLMCVPLYQQHMTREYIYNEDLLANLSPYECEMMANKFDARYLKPDDAITPCIYKTHHVKTNGYNDLVAVTAHAYRGERRVTYVRKMGGDGRSHTIPVHWIEYFPTEKVTNMMVNKNEKTRYEYNNIADKVRSAINSFIGQGHFERGLFAGLYLTNDYSDFGGIEHVMGQAVSPTQVDNIEEIVQKLDKELDEIDKNVQTNPTDEELNNNENLSSEEKEVSENDVEVETSEE